MFALLNEDMTEILEYPILDIKSRYPDKSIPSLDVLLKNGIDNYVPVIDVKPSYDYLTQDIIRNDTPILDNGVVKIAYSVVPKSVEFFTKYVISMVQKRLDDFAQTRNYESILSACTYATSTVPQFAREGQYCVNVRDDTWAKLYQIMQEVEVGTRPMPTGYADIEAELPVLDWANLV